MKRILVSMILMFIMFGSAVLSVSAMEIKDEDHLWDIMNNYKETMDDWLASGIWDEIAQSEQALTSYKVKKGDTLYRIAKAHDVTVEELKQWNGLVSNLILIGQELTISSNEANHSNSVLYNSDKGNKSEANNTRTIEVTATAYTAKCDGCTGITYTGIDLNKNPYEKVIAVDPNIIPLGSKVYVEGYGHAIAGDIGSSIKGKKIDIHVPTKDEAYQWGVKKVDVTIIN